MRYTKAVVAVVAILASYLIARFTGGIQLDPTEWSNVVMAGLTAGTVFTSPNVAHAPVTKSTVAALGAVFIAVNDAISPPSTPAWLQAAVALAGAIGVYALPNRPATPTA